VIKRIAPVGLILAIACRGSSDDVVANYVVKADKSAGGSFGISAPSDLSMQVAAPIGQIPLARSPQQAVDNKVRAFERKNLSLRSGSDPLGNSRFSLRRSIQAPGSAAFAVPVAGDKINVKVPDGNASNLCTSYFTTQAVVASVSSKAILAVDTLDGPPALLFTQQQMDSITTEFDNVTYPTDASYFAAPTDIDANGHVIILFTGRINMLTPAGSTGGFIAGFFFAGDMFPPVDVGGGPGSFCQQSNQAEIFYLLSPDPSGRFGNIRTTSSVRQGTRGTIAHEFQHMINAGNRYKNPAVSNFESTWLDEGLAHFAEDAVGRVQRGFTDLQTLTFSDILPCNTPCSQANDFNAFFFQNLARLTNWMDEPNKYSPTSSLADTSLATRGAAWGILRYAGDNFSNGDPRALTRKLAAGPDTGVKNFTAGAGASIDTLVSGWLVSMYADHLGIAGLNAKYQWRSYNLRSVMPPVAKSVLGQTTATYPLRVVGIGSGSDNIAATNRSGSGTFYRLNVPANSGAKNVKVLDPSGSVASFAGEHVYVLRVQ
jgi:hypothetical protein